MNRITLTRLKFFCLISATTLIFIIKERPVILFIFSAIILLSLLSGSKAKISGRIKSLIFISFYIFLFQLIFNTSLSLAGRMMEGFFAGLKIFSLSLLVFLFTSITSTGDMVEALSFLPKEIRLLFIVTFSMIPSIFDLSERIQMVQNSRGHTTKSINIIKNLVPFIIPLIHLSLRRAEQLSISMESRGYDEG